MARAVPRIQLGLAVYNGEKYLAEALDSILAQTYTDFEVIVSDNASTDRTRRICLNYAGKDRRIRYYRNSTNLGFAPNYNRVFDLSSSEYFKWSDYDDVLEPDFLACCMDALEQDPAAVIAYPRATLIDSSGACIGAYNPGPDVGFTQPSRRFGQMLLRPELAVQTLGLMRRSAILRTSLYQSFPSSDEVFLAQMALLGRFIELPERLLRVRQHEEQSTRGALASQRARCAFYDTALDGRNLLPKWAYLNACLDAIRQTPMRPTERLRCTAVMGRWVVEPAHARALGKDLLLAGNRWMGQLAGACMALETGIRQRIYL